MSFKKIKIISPSTVRNPETGYVYLGWGDVSAVSFTGPWIKQADGTITVISGGTGGGVGVTYWTNPALGYIAPITSHKLRIGGDTTGTQDVNVAGGIKIGNTTTNTSGSIRWTGTDFEGYIGSRWASLTASGSSAGTAGTSYWGPNAQGIIYPDGKVYVGSSFSVSATNDIMNVKGGINLQETTETNVGTIHYYTSGSANSDGFYGYHEGWNRLDVFGYNPNNNKAFYPNGVVIGNIDTTGVDDYVTLFVSGKTHSERFYTTWNLIEPIDGYSSTPSGGFGGYSGTTDKWGITATIIMGASTSDVSYSDYYFDIVNGLIVDVRGRTPK